MIRRLSMKRNRTRSASIAVPGISFSSVDSDDDVRSSTPEMPSRLSPKITRSKSERRYHSTGNMRVWTASDLEDVSADSYQRYYLRCFSVTSKGVVSRGDYVRYRRIRSLSLENPQTKDNNRDWMNNAQNSTKLTVPDNLDHVGASCSNSSTPTSDLGMEEFTVYLIGSSGVGKTALAHQFTTSDHTLNSQEKDDSECQAVTISLDGDESRLYFRELTSVEALVSDYHSNEDLKPCAFLVVYSVTDVDTFLKATCILCQLRQYRYNEDSTIVLVGNKSDLVRSRTVLLEEGHTLACRYKIKFIETSVGINYNVDELLVGVLTHLRLLLQRQNKPSSPRTSRWNRFSRARTSLRKIFHRVLGKDEQQPLSCDIFNVS